MTRTSDEASVKRELAEVIGETLRSSGMSQRELARRSGTTPTQINRMLRPEAGPVSIEAMLRVALVIKPTLRLVLERAPAPQ